MISQALLLERLVDAREMTLFFDYDGTLAEFAPTPAYVDPNTKVAGLLERLAASPRVTVAVLSGRSLSAIEALLPVRGVTLAGSYGVEVLKAGGERVERLSRGEVRPLLDRIKPLWAELIAGAEGFFLEDKVWSLALHARHAPAAEAARVLANARRESAVIGIPDTFRLVGDDQFLEIAPRSANKRDGVDYLLSILIKRATTAASSGPPLFGLRPLRVAAALAYFGDDEHDREAFETIRRRGGYTALVGSNRGAASDTADCSFVDPASLRSWLNRLADRL